MTLQKNKNHFLMDPLKSSALGLEIIEERLSSSIMSPTSIRALLRNPEFQAIQSRNEQLVFLHEFATNVCFTSLNNEALGEIFRISKGNVAKIRSKARKPKEPRGRPQAVDLEAEEIIVTFIADKAKVREFPTKVEVLRFAQENLRSDLSRGWLYDFFGRHSETIGFATAVPQESTRLKVPRAWLQAYLELVALHVNGKHPDFVFNIDETGTSEWEDSKKKKVVVPTEPDCQLIHYDARREIRHQSLEVCISASGDHLVPLAIATEKKTQEAFLTGVRRGKEVNLVIQKSSYLNEELFFQYITAQFISHVFILRLQHSLFNERAILFMDNLRAHCSERILRELGSQNILAISFPPHTSHIFQMLDLVTFGQMKSQLKLTHPNPSLHAAADHLVRSLQALEFACISSSVRGLLRKQDSVFSSEVKLQSFSLILRKSRNLMTSRNSGKLIFRKRTFLQGKKQQNGES
jgi:hypothetical protein